VFDNNTITFTGPSVSFQGIVFTNSGSTAWQGRAAITNNRINMGTVGGAGANGIIFTMANSGGNACVTVDNNQIQMPTTVASIGIRLIGTGVINVDGLSNNITPNIFTSGKVNVASPGSCGQ
jgi:hypothetical protein